MEHLRGMCQENESSCVLRGGLEYELVSPVQYFHAENGCLMPNELD